jgi:hypothetical protein
MDFVSLIIGYLIGFLQYGKGKKEEEKKERVCKCTPALSTNSQVIN